MERVIFNPPTNMVAINDRQQAMDLGAFLARPTLIATLTWDSTIDSSMYPWYAFMFNTQITNKIKNFGLFRGNLHLRFEMSCSPNVYGAALISYCPLYTEVSDSIADGHNYLLQATQRPCAWLYPQESSGVEMVLPFFWKANYVNLFSSDELTDLGEINVKSWTALDTANDTAPPVLKIQTYAWIEDAQLEGPTVQAVLQAGSEYKTGPIERIASAVATVANALSVVPIIRPFALATEMGARAMGSIASLFGWSKVPVIENAIPVNTNVHHGIASSELVGPIQKLSLDSKAEISVDPRIVNLTGQDELNINYLTSKEACLHSFSWVAGDAADATLSSFPVAPSLCIHTTVGNYATVQTPPITYFAQLFEKWRGDIVFRVKIVATKYHRGRLKLTFDPFGAPTAGDYSNVIITKIVDISNDTDVEFVVPYMQATTWLQTRLVTNTAFTAGTNCVFSSQFNNGVFAIEVATPITSPQAVPTADIYVFVKGGANFELAVPGDLGLDYSHLVMQSGQEVTAGKQHPQEYLVNFGENITSMRQVLARNSLSETFYPFKDETFGTNSGVSAIFRITPLPCPNGYDVNATLYSESIVTPTTNERFTFSYMHPLNWVAVCFGAMRGSIQNLFTMDGTLPTSATYQYTRASRAANSNYLIGYGDRNRSWNFTRQICTEYSYDRNHFTGQPGMAMANPSIGEVLHVEVAPKSTYLFQTTKQEDWLVGNSWDETDVFSGHLELTTNMSTPLNEILRVDKRVNIGTDFNLHFFISTPLIYYSTALGQPKYEA